MLVPDKIFYKYKVLSAILVHLLWVAVG